MAHTKEVINAIHTAVIERPHTEGMVGYSEDELEPPEGGPPGIQIYVSDASVSVPRSIAGVPVHKFVLGHWEREITTPNVYALQEPGQKIRPLIGGLAIAPSKGEGYGTLGYFVTIGNDRYVLTNAHVLSIADRDTWQPPPFYHGTKIDKIGQRVEPFVWDPKTGVDAAIVKLLGSVAYSPKLNDLAKDVKGVEPAVKSTIVKKSGASTKVTTGKIIDVKAVVKNGTDIWNNQILISGVNGKFTAPGDSGSLIVVERENGLYAVGLYHMSSDIGVAAASDISIVLKAFNAKLAL